ncbi:hypothetical protein RYO59_001458 [Thermosynechococcaceae cyanobacterium Okahandja]
MNEAINVAGIAAIDPGKDIANVGIREEVSGLAIVDTKLAKEVKEVLTIARGGATANVELLPRLGDLRARAVGVWGNLGGNG